MTQQPVPLSPSIIERDYPLGARVYATCSSGVCAAGEPGVVVELYDLGQGPGRTIVFKGGDSDGFSTLDLAAFTVPEGSVDPVAARYQYAGAGRLSRDAAKFDYSGVEPYGRWLASREASWIAASLPGAPPKPKPGL